MAKNIYLKKMEITRDFGSESAYRFDGTSFCFWPVRLTEETSQENYLVNLSSFELMDPDFTNKKVRVSIQNSFAFEFMTDKNCLVKDSSSVSVQVKRMILSATTLWIKIQIINADGTAKVYGGPWEMKLEIS